MKTYPIEFACPTCCSDIKTTMHYAGTVGRCTECGELIRIPSEPVKVDIPMPPVKPPRKSIPQVEPPRKSEALRNAMQLTMGILLVWLVIGFVIIVASIAARDQLDGILFVVTVVAVVYLSDVYIKRLM